MIANDALDRAEKTLLASPAIDHWQKGRERIEAEELLAHVLGGDPEPGEEIPRLALRRFERLVARRATGEPVPYITGFVEFRGLDLAARPGAFVPRESSEFLAGEAIRRLRGRRRPVAVDLATGTGPVALAVANEVKGSRVFGTDLSHRALSLARQNARRLRLRVTFVKGDLFSLLPREIAGRVDVITFHPPYLGRRELRELAREIVDFEPVESLTDQSPTGMRLIERAAREAHDWLHPGGWLLVEVSPDRSRRVASILRRHGYADVRSRKGGLEVTRVLTGRL